MHIPACDTTCLELVRFDAALEAANRPSPDYDITKWLYVPNFYSEYRYILGTRGEKPLICVGINPSTAAPDAGIRSPLPVAFIIIRMAAPPPVASLGPKRPSS